MDEMKWKRDKRGGERESKERERGRRPRGKERGMFVCLKVCGRVCCLFYMFSMVMMGLGCSTNALAKQMSMYLSSQGQ